MIRLPFHGATSKACIAPPKDLRPPSAFCMHVCDGRVDSGHCAHPLPQAHGACCVLRHMSSLPLHELCTPADRWHLHDRAGSPRRLAGLPHGQDTGERVSEGAHRYVQPLRRVCRRRGIAIRHRRLGRRHGWREEPYHIKREKVPKEGEDDRKETVALYSLAASPGIKLARGHGPVGIPRR